MPRYILIDSASGYVFGDTADYAAGRQSGLEPIEAARLLDEEVVGAYGREYEEVSRQALASNETGYHVYRADVGGSDAIAVFQDGQDPEYIKAVERDCDYVTTIKTNTPTD